MLADGAPVLPPVTDSPRLSAPMSTPDREVLLQRIVDFLRRIGVAVRQGPVPDGFLPGLTLDGGCVVFDPERLQHPGDLLHEAGHLAVCAPERRGQLTAQAGDDGGMEMAAIAWSWAALRHLDLPPETVFHDQGYRGGSQSIIAAFAQPQPFGVPLLEWLGMTATGARAAAAGVAPFPHMLRWLRERPEAAAPTGPPAAAGPAAVRLALRCDPAGLQQDLRQLADDEWVAHYNADDHHGAWHAAALRTRAGALHPIQAIYADPAAGTFADTPLLARCPHLRAALDAFACPLRGVRLMRLGPGAEILPHRDHELGLPHGVARIHVPVCTNPEVDFRLDGRRIAMAPGEVWYLDFGRTHAVANRGATDRVHLVLDCEADDWLRRRVAEGMVFA